ncbi:hypothetical protein BSL78_28423 [Apostichopus japonicus]|uniref:Reverse transcriptase domain-containing protein n=1 Tax=Stichopus japonicus TaxID=307972 RepID=A0A2G8JG72_STIJA|nr:hypothetical protein BSL78_28423 [Apostichopus japonicus]
MLIYLLHQMMTWAVQMASPARYLSDEIPVKQHFVGFFPIVLVRKTDGSLRMCCDYRKLNQKTFKDAYSIQRIEDSIDALHGFQWFSAIDHLSGYHRVAMAETDNRHKTGFITPFGLYELNRMPFGLSNTPAVHEDLQMQQFTNYWFEAGNHLFGDVIASISFLLWGTTQRMPAEKPYHQSILRKLVVKCQTFDD